MSTLPVSPLWWRRLLVVGGLALGLLQVFRAFHGAQTRFITNDGDWYYAYLVSLYRDQDLDLSNQMATWQRMLGAPPLPIPAGRPTATAFSIGPAILWLPAFALADVGALVAHALGAAVERSGYAVPHQLAVALATLLYGVIGVWLAARAAARWAESAQGGSPALSTAAAGTALCASPALYYLLFEPTMAHGLSIFAASLLLWLWLTTGAQATWARWAAVGGAGGLCALIRPQDGLLLLLPVSTILLARPPRLARLLPLSVAAGAAFLPQMVVWWLTFGRPFAVPEGPEFMRWTHPALLQVWFSHHHGLFTWTPVWLLAVLGVAGGPRQTRGMAAAMAVVFLLESYVSAAARDWWAGDSYGARRFLGLFPIFVLGLTLMAGRLTRRSPYPFLAIAGTAVVTNLILMAAYVTDRIPHG